MIDLRTVPTSALRAELARRELAAPLATQDQRSSEDEVERWKWICECGNAVVSGGQVSTVFAESGEVWCRICYPRGRNLYGKNGTAISVPMKRVPVD